MMVNPQVSLLNLTLGAGIPDNVMWSLIDDNPIMPVLHHDGVFVARVDACLEEEIDGWRGRGGHHSVPTKV